jgi:hypothetical protein
MIGADPAMAEPAIRPSPARAVGLVCAAGALAALVYFTVHVVSVELRLGARIAVRSAAGLALPMLAGGYAFASGRTAAGATARVPAAIRFAASAVLAALAMASIHFFLHLIGIPVPIAELLLASCIAIVAVAAGRALDARHRASASFASAYGVAAGLLLFVAVYGVPRIGGG